MNALTGTEIEGSNTSANRSRPLPLLVVHSGKTTTGLLDAFLMLSSDLDPSNGSPFVDGVCPSDERIFHSDTWWKPVIGIRCMEPDLLIVMAAEPVPVRRPGTVGVVSVWTGWGVGATGSMNIGSKLWSMLVKSPKI